MTDVNPTTLTTPQLLDAAAKAVGPGPLADELAIRSYRLSELEYQAKPDRNDLTGQTPTQIMAMVNAPSPQ